ncbi:hypothetical protein AOQ84DRAFT_323190 [Glonium stellatum]|uniref:Uncharacterized protein n=1 Tax=Glonium stellatum TaxID=574774 RepID=A0A8E2EUR8_9PEZI|nr:hypothetical protein AOQ84DRAFT_323190 [Glonium stellatum]
MISFFDRKNIYLLAEATRTLSLQTSTGIDPEDNLWWGTSILPKDNAICDYTVRLPVEYEKQQGGNSNDITALVINDLSLDERFKDKPYVTGKPYLRFYAGVPIRSPNGHNIGSYCVVDDKPREGISTVERAFMKDMAITVMRHLEMTKIKEDHRRGGIMVRGLGSFVKGKSSLKDLWPDPWDYTETILPTTPLVQSTLHTSPMATRRSTSSDDFIEIHRQSTSSPTHPPADSALGSDVLMPELERYKFVQVTHSVSQEDFSAENHLREESLTPDVKSTFKRASKIILEATEVDGAIFFDASIGTFGGLVEDAYEKEAQRKTSIANKLCDVLGSAFNEEIAATVGDQLAHHYPMTEAVLRDLLRHYPRGKVFNFDEEEFLLSGNGSSGDSPPVLQISHFLGEELLSAGGQRSSKPKPHDHEKMLHKIFPAARSLVLCPLWDSHRARWFAGAIVWSSDPMRVLTSELELSFFTAFGNSVMAEVAILDTKRADRAKGDFISSISHELRSPLHGILGSCELLGTTVADTFQANMTQTIETCGKTLLDTINHVLDFAKINSFANRSTKNQGTNAKSRDLATTASQKSDGLTLSSDVDLSALTEEVLETVFAGHNFQKSATDPFRTNCADARLDLPLVSIIVDITKADNWIFRTQPGAWRRVLMNLFGNALKYTCAGFIKIKLQACPSITDPSGKTSILKLTVSDSGKGISQEYLRDHLFHSFAQEDSLTQGTGLGLSIVHQIVTSLGGEVDVQSEKGVGTKVAVMCPLTRTHISSDTSPTLQGTELQDLINRTSGMKISLVGFDKESSFVTASNFQGKKTSALVGKSFEKICKDWFKMKIQPWIDSQPSSPDIYLTTEAEADLVKSRYVQKSELAGDLNIPQGPCRSPPVIVFCRVASPYCCAPNSVCPIALDQTFKCVSQPCGPRKLAKVLSSCLDSHAHHSRKLSDDLTQIQKPFTVLNIKDETTLKRHHNIQATDLDDPHSSRQTPVPISAPVTTLKRPSRPAATPPSSHRPLSILAVDDNPINLHLLRTFISKLHHRNTTATNGLEAVSLYKTSCPSTTPSLEYLTPSPTSPPLPTTTPLPHFDVVLMDINMPIMDGLEASRRIRAHERETGVRPVTIIAVTGHASAQAQQEAFTSGVNLFLTKPVVFKELEVVLRGVRNQEREAGDC